MAEKDVLEVIKEIVSKGLDIAEKKKTYSELLSYVAIQSSTIIGICEGALLQRKSSE